KEFNAKPLHALVQQIGNERAAAARKERAALTLAERRQKLRKDWTGLLGDVEPAADPQLVVPPRVSQLGKVRIERIHLSVEPGIVVPMVLLIPPQGKGQRLPVVVGVAQAGKQEFFRQRAEVLAALLEEGVAVALPDVRGTGETSPGEARDRRSPATALSATGLMLGQSLLGAR